MKWLACCGVSHKSPPETINQTVDLNTIKMDLPDKDPAGETYVHPTTPRYVANEGTAPTEDDSRPSQPASSPPKKAVRPQRTEDIDLSDNPEMQQWVDQQMVIAQEKLKKQLVKQVASYMKVEQERSIEEHICDAMTRVSLNPTQPPTPSELQEDVFDQEVSKLKKKLASPDEYSPPLEWIKKLQNIISKVVTPNMDALTATSSDIIKQQLSTVAEDFGTKKELQEKHVSRKAGQTLRVVSAAVDEAFKQFRAAVLEACKKSSISELVDFKDIELVCNDIMKAEKESCLESFTHSSLKALVIEEVHNLGGSVVANKISSVDDVPDTLLKYIKHEHEAPADLSVDLHDWLQYQMCMLLDPYIDVDVDNEGRQARMTPAMTMYETVCDLYQEAFGESMDGVISVEQVLLAYIAHAMHKMNCIHGFVAHMPGMSRQPVSQYAQFRHLKMLGQALLAGVQRDFPAEQQMLEYTQVTSEMLQLAAEEHVKMLYKEEDERSTELAVANMLGEEARKAERMRLWGIST